MAVYDTNILISALLSLTGSHLRCLALARAGVLELESCGELPAEFREKLERKFQLPSERAQAACDEVRRVSRLVSIPRSLFGVTRDPDHDKIVECALAGGAGYLVAGDRRHLLPLRVHRG